MKDTIIIIILIIWIVALPNSYQEIKDSIHIPKEWKFQTGDNPSFLKPDFNKQHWRTTKGDSLPEIKGYSGYKSPGWYNHPNVFPGSYNNTYLLSEYQIFLHQ
jgi:hypothetical protein